MNRIAIVSLATVSTLGLAAAGSLRSNATPVPDCCTSGGAEPPHADSIAVHHTLTLEGANRVIAAALALARERHAGGAIAVVDDAGNLMALQRLDGTFGAASGVSTGKARTAALFKKPTKAFEDSINNGRVALAAVAEMTPLQGGIPIMHEGSVVGAIGVSGAHSQQEDEEIALAGAAVFGPTSAATQADHAAK